MAIYTDKVKKREIFIIFVILGLALFFRVIYLNDYKDTQVYPLLPYSDGYAYFLWAKDIISGDILGSKAFMKWPLYAYFLAFLLKVSSQSIVFIYAVQSLLGTISCILIYFIAKRLFNEIIAILSALLYVWYGLFIFYDSLLIYTSLSGFLNSLLFLFILYIQNHPNKNNLFWLGIFLGLCTIAQANIVIFGILAIVWILWKKRLDFGKLIHNFLYFIIGLSIVIGTVTLRNYLVEKDFVLIAGNLGFNFYSGNNPQASGKFYCPEDVGLYQEGMFRDAKVIARISSGKELKTSEVSNFWFNKSIDFIRHNPGAYLKLLFKKFIYLFSPKESIHEMEYYYVVDKIKIFKIMFLDLRFILPLSFLGILFGFKRFKNIALLYINLFALSLSIILFFVTTRYRIMMVPYLIIFASFGIFNFYEAIRKKEYLKFGFLCIVVIPLFILFTKNKIEALNPPSLDKPNNHYSLLSLGAMHYQMNNFKMAEENFKEATKFCPFSIDAYYNLGLLYNKQKRFAEAREVLEKAVFLDPEDLGAHFELGKTYKAIGELKKANEEFIFVLNKLSRWRIQERESVERQLKELSR